MTDAAIKQKYLITNLCYGSIYYKIFTEQHLKSCLDETNLPAIKNRFDTTYMIFTDEETLPHFMEIKEGEKLQDITAPGNKEDFINRLRHPNLKRLAHEVTLKFAILGWVRDDHTKFDMRYSVLTEVCKKSIEMAIEQNAWLTAWVADLVVARDFFPKVLGRLEDGHGAVFVQPYRSAFETMAKILAQVNRALTPQELFFAAHANVLPLQQYQEFRSIRLTKLPFALFWSTPKGAMAKLFSVTPVVFKPKQGMLAGRCMLDGDIPAQCANPYWATNWTDAPVIGCEPLYSYSNCYQYMPSKKDKRKFVRAFSMCSIHPTQIMNMVRTMYYPDKKTAKVGWRAWLEARSLAKYILR